MSIIQILEGIRKTSSSEESSDLTNIKYDQRDNIKDLSYIDTFLKVISQSNQLTIVYANVDTAFINVENKEVTLPNYIIHDRDMYILMGSHEISHAIHTPSVFYSQHNNTDNNDKTPIIKGIKLNKNLFACINIVEDIRIEKLIRNQFPGFVSIYKAGYKKLLDTNPNFKVTEASWKKMSLSNKINVKSKAGDLINYPLTDDEIAVLKYMKTAKSFDDVLVRAVYLYKHMLINHKKNSSFGGGKSDSDKIKDFLEKIDDELGDAQEAADMSSEDAEAFNSNLLSELNDLIESLEASLDNPQDISGGDVMEESREKYVKKAERAQHKAHNFNAKEDKKYKRIVKNPLSAII